VEAPTGTTTTIESPTRRRPTNRTMERRVESSEDTTAFEKQVLEVYLSGLESELETKLHELRVVRRAIERLSERHDGLEQLDVVRALAGSSNPC
jgi:hypothetical protein